jgi:uncharacterized DUF497 family protein
VRFSWDPDKAVINARKHGVTFEEAVTVFADPLARLVEDALHSDRSLLVGESAVGRVLVVVFVELSEEAARIVSARRATSRERRNYEEDQEE